MKAQFLALLVLASVAVSCAKKASSADPAADAAAAVPVPDAYVPPTTGVGMNPGRDFAFGGTSEFVFDSADLYRQYTQRYINNLSQISRPRVNLNFDKFGSSYGGTLTIRYELGGQTYEGFFTSGHDSETTKYNIWFTQNGARVWHGFFEDFRGATVVVIDRVVETVDSGTTTRLGSGSVWFKNFDFSLGLGRGPYYCWYIPYGPYDCRAWKAGDVVNTTAALYPDSGYVRLGTFQNINLNKAFNDLVW
jgi:hypothetical protein